MRRATAVVKNDFVIVGPEATTKGSKRYYAIVERVGAEQVRVRLGDGSKRTASRDNVAVFIQRPDNWEALLALPDIQVKSRRARPSKFSVAKENAGLAN